MKFLTFVLEGNLVNEHAQHPNSSNYDGKWKSCTTLISARMANEQVMLMQRLQWHQRHQRLQHLHQQQKIVGIKNSFSFVFFCFVRWVVHFLFVYGTIDPHNWDRPFVVWDCLLCVIELHVTFNLALLLLNFVLVQWWILFVVHFLIFVLVIIVIGILGNN